MNYRRKQRVRRNIRRAFRFKEGKERDLKELNSLRLITLVTKLFPFFSEVYWLAFRSFAMSVIHRRGHRGKRREEIY